MKKIFINKNQIARHIAQELRFPITKVLKTITDFEEEIAKNLKAKGKVKLTHFGTFYLQIRKSRVIKEIKNKSPRLLLDQNWIRFKPASLSKQILFGTKPKEASEAPPTGVGGISTLRAGAKSRTEGLSARHLHLRQIVGALWCGEEQPIDQMQPAKNRLPAFKPLAIMSRVEKGKIQKKIYERLLKLAQKIELELKKETRASLPTHKILPKTTDERVFASLFKQIFEAGVNNIHFALENTDTTKIYHGRPRNFLTRVPTILVRQFLDRCLELEHFEIPQERLIKLVMEGNPRQSLFLNVYSLPHATGASLYFRISGRKIISG